MSPSRAVAPGALWYVPSRLEPAESTGNVTEVVRGEGVEARKPRTQPGIRPRRWASSGPTSPNRANLPEFTFKAVLFGAIFGIIFGAVTVYVGLRAGLTVSASIPIAVLSISLLRAFGKATILENNIVQTAGSAGESVAAGAIFTLPALIFMGFPFEYSRIFMLALIGGWIGVLFMIPLRRQLIVQEHGNLLYPEGTACADVLVAGEKGGSFASRVFWGLGLGGAYTFLMATAQVWKQRPLYEPTWLPGASFRAEITSEYLGVGYIIGPKIAGTIFAGGVFSWLVLMPAIKFFGEGLADPLYPSTIPIRNMTPGQMWENYIRPMGAGAVAMAGLITLMKTMPTIVNALRSGIKDVRAQQAGAEAGSGTARSRPRHEVGAARLARDHRGDVADADVQPDRRRAGRRDSRTWSRRSSWCCSASSSSRCRRASAA